jgi:hypothetical protein
MKAKEEVFGGSSSARCGCRASASPWEGDRHDAEVPTNKINPKFNLTGADCNPGFAKSRISEPLEMVKNRDDFSNLRGDNE